MVDSVTPDIWQRVKEIFDRAIDLPLAERQIFLQQACADNPILHSQVTRLIDADNAVEESSLDYSPFSELRENWNPDNDILVGEVVGGFRILRLIGSGGMGSVYEAVRVDETAHRVAVKLISMFASTELMRRFREERKILAALAHPNIALFVDSGISSQRIPYYAMEFVDGIEIDDYCKTNRLAVEERLRLFLTVCSAVSYAHRHLVIHRDLKPANILVTQDGCVKLLDFGIAKFYKPDDESLRPTVTAHVAMTPAYSSPEQLAGQAVTTASDVYSLGILLFELLTGSRPFPEEDSSAEKLLRAISETSAPKPSSVITREFDIANDGTQESIRVARKLRGDLDNIILKALNADSNRRYASVDQFVADIQAYLHGRPVAACRDAFTYRAQKFFRRNRTPSIAATLIILSLCVGIAATVRQTVRLRREKLIAERRFDDIRSLANKFMFEYHDRVGKLPGGTELRASIIRDAAVYLDRLSQDSTDDLALQIELANAYLKLGQVQGEPYSDNLGDTDGATDSYKKAVALLEHVSEERGSDVDTLSALSRAYVLRANLMARTGEAGYAGLIQKSVGLDQRLVSLEPDNVSLRAQLVKSYIALADYGGHIWSSSNERMDAYRMALSEAQDLVRISPNDPDALRALLTSHQRLSMNLFWQGNSLAERDGLTPDVNAVADEAVAHAEAALNACDTLERLEKNGIQTSNYRIKLTSDLGLAKLLRHDRETASVLIKLLESARERARKDLSNHEAHLDIALIYSYLGRAYAAEEEWTQAIDSYRQSLLVLDEMLGSDSSNREVPTNKADILLMLGKALAESGDLQAASVTFDRAEELSKGPDFRSNVLLPIARADLRLSMSRGELNLSDRTRDLTLACSFYQNAADSLSTIDLKRDHIDHLYLDAVVVRKLQGCRNESAAISEN